MEPPPLGALFGARFSPGFSVNLSRWSLFICEDGTLFQKTKVSEHRPGRSRVEEVREESVPLELEFVKDLLAQAVAILNNPPIAHSGMMMMDSSERILKARVDGRWRNVPDYEFADDYRALWKADHLYTLNNSRR